MDHNLEDLVSRTTQRRILWEEEIAAARSAAFFESMRNDLEETVNADGRKVRRSTMEM